jgi:hypothetical protein
MTAFIAHVTFILSASTETVAAQHAMVDVHGIVMRAMNRAAAVSMLVMVLISVAACSPAPVRSSFRLEPGRRAVLTLMPTVDEILLTNRGPGTVQMDLEDTRLLVFMAVTFRSGDRHTYREPALARVRFANDSLEPALIEFSTWGGGAQGFDLDLAPPPAQLPETEDGS